MKYLLICTECGQKHFTDGTDLTGLVEIKTAPLPKRADGKSNETYPLPRKFKCYNCGFAFKPVKLTEPKNETKIVEEKPKEPLDDEQYFKQWENESLKSTRSKTLPPQV